MDVTWSALAGDTSKFAFELSFSRDTESHLYDADERASWGSFTIWVEGINLMEHVEQGRCCERLIGTYCPPSSGSLGIGTPFFTKNAYRCRMRVQMQQVQ